MNPPLAFRAAPPGAPAGGGTNLLQRFRQYWLLLVVAIIAALPLVLRGTSCGQDFDFHLQNWLEVNRSWHQGVLYPHWAASASYGAGEPRFIFYPPLSWMLGACLGTVLPWTWTPFAFALLALLGSGWSFQMMAREWMSRDAALAGACLYVVNPYMLFVLYEREALAEMLAAIWIPLLVLYGLSRKPAQIPLAFTIAFLWLTNAPAAVMGCYMLAGLVAVAALQQRSWPLVRRALGAVPLGLALAAFWLVPAIYEQGWVQIRRAIGPLMRVEDSFLFERAQWPGRLPLAPDEVSATAYHNQVLHTASWIVVSLFLSAAVAAGLSYRRRSIVWAPLVVVAGAIVALQFRWSDLIWRITPELKFLQFPWRWMFVLGLIAAALAGLALDAGARNAVSRLPVLPKRSLHPRVIPAAILMLAVGLAALAALHFWQACDKSDSVPAQLAVFRASGFEGTDEYAPRTAGDLTVDDALSERHEMIAPVTLLDPAQSVDLYDFADDSSAPPTAPGQVRIERWNTEHMTADLTAPHPLLALVRLMDYPAWRIRLDGSSPSVGIRQMNGLLLIPIAPGTHRIDIRWTTTGDAWAGRGISLAALVFTLAWNWKQRRKTGTVPIP